MRFKNLFKKKEHCVAAAVDLDNVQSFVIYEEDYMNLIAIAENGFKLEKLDDNWWMCRKCE